MTTVLRSGVQCATDINFRSLTTDWVPMRRLGYESHRKYVGFCSRTTHNMSNNNLILSSLEEKSEKNELLFSHLIPEKKKGSGLNVRFVHCMRELSNSTGYFCTVSTNKSFEEKPMDPRRNQTRMDTWETGNAIIVIMLIAPYIYIYVGSTKITSRSRSIVFYDFKLINFVLNIIQTKRISVNFRGWPLS